jgi:hypothetical protein
VPADAERLVLVGDDGNEYHFGSGMWAKRGTFLHVATYSPDDGLQKYAFFWELADAISEGRVSQQPEPELGPKLSRRAVIALKELRMLCNLHNGFYGEPEKRWAVDTLRALWEEAHERYEPAGGLCVGGDSWLGDERCEEASGNRRRRTPREELPGVRPSPDPARPPKVAPHD